jgi:Zn finger protein HypA/HybF involved in hydrogenase expression
MHEMGIACSVLDAVHKELDGYPGQQATKIGLQIGESAGVDPESLRFCFEAMVKNTEWEPVALEIEWCKAGDGCRGDELRIAYLELEDVTQGEDVAPGEEAPHEPRNC